MSPRRSLALLLPLLAFASLSGPASTVSGQQLLKKLHSNSREAARDLIVRRPPRTAEDDCIEQLAREIDWLEAYLDQYGSVVAKHPDVWGESRLIKFRNEYEREMSAQLGSFAPTINATIARSDLAFYSRAAGLGLALNGGTAPNVTIEQSMVGTVGANSSKEDPKGETAGKNGEDAKPDTKPETAGSAAGLPSQTVQLEGAPEMGFGRPANGFLEPTTSLDQRSRYLNHLQSLRRINEGDDTSDSPGYSLNLVRIPVSINPGRETRSGHGAEITITATPHLSDTLLPETFRGLVINDLTDQLALPILKMAESPELEFTRQVQLFDRKHRCEVEHLQRIAFRLLGTNPDDLNLIALMCEVFPAATVTDSYQQLRSLINDAKKTLQVAAEGNVDAATRAKAQENTEKIDELVAIIDAKMMLESGCQGPLADLIELYKRDESVGLSLQLPATPALFTSGTEEMKTSLAAIRDDGMFRSSLAALQGDYEFQTRIKTAARNALESLPRLFEALSSTYFDFARVAVNPVSRRRSALPIPQVLLESVVGRTELVEIALELKESYEGRYVAWNQDPALPAIHLADVRHFLQSNLRGAYDLLALPQNRSLLVEFIEPGMLPEGLAAAVRAADVQQLASARARFETLLQPEGRTSSIMVRMAWAVLVEMALLNDQLNRDVHDIAVTRGDCGCHPGERNAFYLPMPPDHAAEQADPEFQAATRAFQEYVRCRWPILVFQVEPVNEEQNVSENSQLARELAVATAIGLSSGKLNYSQASRLSRQYQQQIEAISLNRTISGFSHSHDTFGWRFRPRIQTHKGQSTVRAFGETVFGRLPDANLREAAIEPGMRECTAIVLMPSFVPYCDFDVRSNWFRLDNPRAADLSMHQSMKLSRSIKSMQDCSAQCAACAHLYRDGEPERLLKRVGQLDRELPLQSMRVQIPYENTLGGFEMFSNGVTDLAPELVGWYGGPGILLGQDACSATGRANAGDSGADAAASREAYGAGTTVFLVGDNFSVHETRVLAGGVEIPREHTKLLSRQVLQVTVPVCARTVVFPDQRNPDRAIHYVAIHAATPYGVTSHLHVPAILPPDAGSPAAVAELGKRVEALETVTRSITWSWKSTDELRIAHSFHPAGGGTFNLSCIQPADRSGENSYQLNFAGSLPGPNAVVNPQELHVVGQLVLDNRALGGSFYIVGTVDGGGWVFKTDGNRLISSMTQVLQSISMDDIGNEPTTNLSLQVHVVFIDVNKNLIGEPRLVVNRIPVVLERRTAPPTNQRCESVEPRAATPEAGMGALPAPAQSPGATNPQPQGTTGSSDREEAPSFEPDGNTDSRAGQNRYQPGTTNRLQFRNLPGTAPAPGHTSG